MKISAAIAISLALLTQHASFAQGVNASEADLKAAFCFKTVQSRFQFMDEMIANETPEIRSKLESAYQSEKYKYTKITNYLAARRGALGSDGLSEILVAMKAGDDAFNEVGRISKACTAPYSRNRPESQTGIDMKKVDQCTKDAGVEHLGLEKCRELSFLPY